MHSRIRRFFSFFGLTLAPLLLCAGKSYYEPSEYWPSIFHPQPRELVQVSHEFLPSLSLNQGTTGTCYAHSAYFLLQYYYSFYHWHHRNGFPVWDRLSLFDILGQACDEKLKNGGRSYEVLYQIKNKPIYLNVDLNIQEAFRLKYELKEMDLTDPLEFNNWVELVRLQLGNLTDATLADRLKNIHPEQKEFVFRSLKAGITAHKTGQLQVRETQLPHYNIHVFELNDQVLKEVQTKHPSVTKVKIVLDLMKHLLQPIKYENTSLTFPVEFSFRSEIATDPSERNRGFHSVAITGYRKTCSQDCHQEESWTEEWFVKNSYGNSKTGWYKARPLAESFVEYKKAISYIRPCKELNGLFHQEIDLPYCSNAILGAEFPPAYGLSPNDFRGVNPLKTMIYFNDYDTLSEILFNYSDQLDQWINTPDRLGFTPLIYAAMKGHEQMTRSLLEYGAKADFVNQYNKSPLYYAVESGNLETVHHLYQKEPKLLSIQSTDGNNPFHNAIERDQIEVIQYLANQDPGILNVTDSRGRFPITVAASNNNLAMIKFLLNNERTRSQITPSMLGRTLGKAVTERNLDIVAYLLEFGVDPNGQGESLGYPLNAAAEESSIELIDLLLKKGANINGSNNKMTPLGNAVIFGTVEFLEHLLTYHPDLEGIIGKDKTPLFLAARSGELEALKILRRAGANLEVKTNKGITPLAIALIEGHFEIARYLLEEGADASVVLKDGRSIQDLVEHISDSQQRNQIKSMIDTSLKSRTMGQNSNTLGKRKF